MSKKLIKFLDENEVLYECLCHAESFTAAETAGTEHVVDVSHVVQISDKSFVKVVMIKVDDRDAMVVVPSNRTIDLFKLSYALGSKNVRVAEEKEFKDLFPESEVGAMPPVGNSSQVACYADKTIRKTDHVYFNAGNHLETVKISTKDFLRISKAKLGDFSVAGKKIKT